MTGCDFDWMVSNHAVWGWKAPVKASVSRVSFLQLFPFFASIFPLFPQKRLMLKLLGTDSHRTISKRSRECWFLIGLKKCFVLVCPIGEQFLLSSFREFVHDGYYLATVARFVPQAFLTRNEGTTNESKNVSDAISRGNSLCTEKILFLTDHNVS